jgi:hypothetical protein
MHGIENRFKKSLSCFRCLKILKDPVELPCGDLVCKEDLTENAFQIKCFKCKQEFEVEKEKIKYNKFAKQMLDEKVYLSNEEIGLKEKIEESIKVFYKMYEEFILNKSKLDLDCHNHFQEVRCQIDLHRENLKKKIDEIYMEMIEKTKEVEASYLKSLNEKLDTSLKPIETKSIELDIEELNEAFRDPNIVIESIREIQIKQEKAIELFQSILNEVNKLKSNLNSLNEFVKPNFSYDKDLFGQLKLNGYFSFDPFKSVILTDQQPSELIKLCEFNQTNRFKLLYRASRDGFGSNDFHSKCDGHSNTLTIYRANGFIFGGYTSACWESCHPAQWKFDSNAFLFSLTNKENEPCKMKIKSNKHQYAIYCNLDYGPTFGGGGDIEIASNSNANKESFTFLGWAYKHPKYVAGTNKAESFLAGEFNFQLSEIEVYQKE